MTFQGRYQIFSGEVSNIFRGGIKYFQGRYQIFSGDVQSDLRGGAHLSSKSGHGLW